jgi:hypothetical protein
MIKKFIQNLKDRFSIVSKKERLKKHLESRTLFNKMVKEARQNKYKIELGLSEIERDGYTFRLGDKVICRSNEPDPLVIGEIVEFWDNDGKWTNCIPYIKDENGKLWGCMGIIRPYSEKLMAELKHLRPLEQWNYFVDEPYKYTPKKMDQKEKRYQQIQKNRVF